MGSQDADDKGVGAARSSARQTLNNLFILFLAGESLTVAWHHEASVDVFPVHPSMTIVVGYR